MEIREIRQGFFELDVPTVLCHAFPQVLSAGVSVVTSGSFCVPTAGCRLKRKGHNMKITYKFADGTVSEVEVSEEIGTLIMDSRRAEHAGNERHRYHTAFSLDDMDYEGKDYFSATDNPEKAFMEKEFAKKREAMLSQLTPVQRRRFELFEDGMTVAEIARKEKAAFNSVKESIESAQKKLKKFF